ncbi:uncharacterized protein ACLA_043930 [Aspergillus clavatus NRRL 1]|uniref:Uncharacterized protein n=1 Tax=Aspergillus clavatus (strain ATCC 1007 / CBS 513.65 / DSM 816 / NCTC 3887 / NRRL 1 / QM 1276 / 107) TaxID=344612 RepID=A1C8N6_ASPCL|nr:uncharacterized protein ACLA_043930 [Aspergillus clavatus NRRL 1]EAW13673.1 conserved hypothetical protein [Aspergillus clavatus NRRL 1]
MLLSSLLNYAPLLALPVTVAARRGGGGDSEDSGDSSSDSSSGSRSSSSSGDSCGSKQYTLYKYDLVPRNAQNWTTNAGGQKGRNPTTYDGSYFQGEAFLGYTATGGSRCPNATGSVRMLGYAWIGPQTPYPKGPENSIIIGFKAWETDKALEDITFSYDYLNDGLYCPRPPGLVKLMTTRSWTDWDARTYRAGDIVRMNLFPDQTRADAVSFNASTIPNLSPAPAYDEGDILLPASSCSSDERLSVGWPEGTNITGSITNTTLSLTIVGAGDTNTAYKYYVGKEDDIHVTFNVTFSGTFDRINSTRSVAVQQESQPMLFWVDNSSVMVGPGEFLMKPMWLAWTALFFFL